MASAGLPLYLCALAGHHAYRHAAQWRTGAQVSQTAGNKAMRIRVLYLQATAASALHVRQLDAYGCTRLVVALSICCLQVT